MELDKTEIRQVLDALVEEESDGAVAMYSFLSGLRRQMDDDDVAEITAVIQ